MDLRGAQGTPPRFKVQIRSFPCSFLENLAKWYVPPQQPGEGELAPPPLANPGSATGLRTEDKYGFQMGMALC